jgi:pimeloyl-ACP methyl ester carboxylesterase
VGGGKNCFLGARDAWRWLDRHRGNRAASRARAMALYSHNVAAYAAAVDWSRDTDIVGTETVRLERLGFAREPFAELVPSYLAPTYEEHQIGTTEGVGGPLLAVFPRTHDRDARWPYLGPDVYARCLTAVLSFEEKGARLELLDPDHDGRVALWGESRPLQFDETAALGYMVSKRRVDYESETLDALFWPEMSDQTIFMLSPPDPKRKPLLFVHGLKASPQEFRSVFNTIASDPKIRSEYQVVIYRYATGYSLFWSNGMFRSRLKQFFSYLQKVAPDAHARGTIAVGHSMGGLQIKALAQSSGDTIWNAMFAVPPDQVEMTSKVGRKLRKSLIFEPVPEITRLVFMAVPHRGAPYVEGFIGLLGSALIFEDDDVAKFKSEVLEQFGSQVRPEVREHIDENTTSVDSMNPANLYRNLLLKLPIRVPFHSIIGDRDGSQTNPETDGIVPYTSSHLEGAESEVIIKSGHHVTDTPECAQELRRILFLALK